MTVPLIDCVNIWKTFEVANLVFQWIFVLNSVKHKSFPVSIVKGELTQWKFWCCNDIGVTSASISVWHCWYIVNEKHDDVSLHYQPDIKILRLDQSNFNVDTTSSRKRTLRKKSSRIVYLFSISHNNVTLIYYGNWKIKASGDFFSVVATKNMLLLGGFLVVFFSKQRYST